jgi:hypothetical protein
VLLPTQGPINLVLGNNIPRDTDISAALTGDTQHDATFLQAMEHLWEFNTNRQASFDPIGDHMPFKGGLTRVWLAYVHQHPFRYVGEILSKMLEWFFPRGNMMLFLSLASLAGIAFLVPQRGRRAGWILVVLIAAYSLPPILSYFEGRHRKVIIPEMMSLSALGIWSISRAARGKTAPAADHQDSFSLRRAA